MTDITPTQIAKLRQIAEAPGPVPVKELRASNITLNRMVAAFWIQKQIIDGRSHYRLTERGIRKLAAIAKAEG